MSRVDVNLTAGIWFDGIQDSAPLAETTVGRVLMASLIVPLMILPLMDKTAFKFIGYREDPCGGVAEAPRKHGKLDAGRENANPLKLVVTDSIIFRSKTSCGLAKSPGFRLLQGRKPTKIARQQGMSCVAKMDMRHQHYNCENSGSLDNEGLPKKVAMGKFTSSLGRK